MKRRRVLLPKLVLPLAGGDNFMSNKYMTREDREFKEREQNAGVENEVEPKPVYRGIGNWNRMQLSRMSRNPNTRRNSSRT